MIINLTPFVVLALMAWGARVLARRAWDRMPTEQTPSAYDRSQRRNRAGAALYDASRPQIRQLRYARRRRIDVEQDK